jgi:hypothetical protein
MRRTLCLSVLTFLPFLAPWSEAPAPVANAVGPRLETGSRTLSAIRVTVAARRDRAPRPRPGTNAVALDRETPLVPPGETVTLDVPVLFNTVQPTSLEVRSGCLAYDFGIYPDATYTAGRELLLYEGQSLNLVDGALPALRDDDRTGEIHAKFRNRGDMGCTFELLISGSGF